MGFDPLSFVIGQQAGKASGGGSVEGVHFVTFMNEDGTTELYKRPVADGDDCADPVKRGLIDEPTKESTAQYNYTHVGWSASPNGALDENILKAVTADKTVYANFAGVLRYYTITYYDSDGTTVLKTESLAYGSLPSYEPTHEEYLFDGWNPEIETVIGDASYIVVWKEKPVFSTATWAEIAAVCNSGNAASVFSIGETKAVTLTYEDGTTETIDFRIVDMDKDVDANGETLSLTLMADNLVKNKLQPASSSKVEKINFYEMDNAATFFNSIYEALPSDLQDVIIAAKKYYLGIDQPTTQKVFIPSCLNLKITPYVNDSSSYPASNVNRYYFPQSTYKYFADGGSPLRTTLASSSDDQYWTTSVWNYSFGSYVSANWNIIDGTTRGSRGKSGSGYSFGVCPCFCIGKKGV